MISGGFTAGLHPAILHVVQRTNERSSYFSSNKLVDSSATRIILNPKLRSRITFEGKLEMVRGPVAAPSDHPVSSLFTIDFPVRVRSRWPREALRVVAFEHQRPSLTE